LSAVGIEWVIHLNDTVACTFVTHPSERTALEVALPSGVVLRFGQVVPVEYLKALL